MTGAGQSPVFELKDSSLSTSVSLELSVIFSIGVEEGWFSKYASVAVTEAPDILEILLFSFAKPI